MSNSGPVVIFNMQQKTLRYRGNKGDGGGTASSVTQRENKRGLRFGLDLFNEGWYCHEGFLCAHTSVCLGSVSSMLHPNVLPGCESLITPR